LIDATIVDARCGLLLVFITIAINVNGGTQGSTISASAGSRAEAIRRDGALHRRAPRRATFFHRSCYQAFLDALRM